MNRRFHRPVLIVLSLAVLTMLEHRVEAQVLGAAQVRTGAAAASVGASRSAGGPGGNVPLAVGSPGSGPRDPQSVATRIGQQLTPSVIFPVDMIVATGTQNRFQTFCPFSRQPRDCFDPLDPYLFERRTSAGPEWIQLQISPNSTERLLPMVEQPACYVVVWRDPADINRFIVSYPFTLYGRVPRATSACP